MTIQQAIEKAIEGGWNYDLVEPLYATFQGKGVKEVYEPDLGAKLPLSSILLDPIFWQSLGKGMKWNQEKSFSAEWNGNGYIDTTFYTEAQYYWHRFIDHLAEGKSIESFFESLSTN